MLKKKYEIGVIGAGIIGCSIVWELLDRGVEVVLIDANERPLMGSSMAGFGSLTPYSDPYFEGEARDFAGYSVDLYRERWIPRIGTDHGRPIPFGNDGLIELFNDNQDFEKAVIFSQELNSGRDGVSRVLSVDEVREVEPNLTGEFVGGLWFDEPWLDKAAYFESLESSLVRQAGDNIKLHTKIERIRTLNGEFQIASSTKEIARCRKLVICTGLFGLGIDGLPTLPRLSWTRGDAIGVYALNDRPLLSRHIYMGNGFITPRKDGYMLLGATYIDEGELDVHHLPPCDRISVADLQNLLAYNQEILPTLKDCEIARVWRGWRPTPPDRMPLLGSMRENPSLVVANGFIGLGITMAPAVAQSIADYLLLGIDNFPKSFDPNRNCETGGAPNV